MFSPFLDNSDGSESFVGYEDNEGEEEDDDKDFISDLLSLDDDSEEVPCNMPMNCPLTCLLVMAFHQPRYVTAHMNIPLLTKMLTFLSCRLQPLS
jgi:hypothetical protein